MSSKNLLVNQATQSSFVKGKQMSKDWQVLLEIMVLMVKPSTLTSLNTNDKRYIETSKQDNYTVSSLLMSQLVGLISHKSML